MKLRTNLGPTQLERIAKALKSVDQGKEFVPENDAERELLRQADQVYDLFCESLSLELKKILLEE